MIKKILTSLMSALLIFSCLASFPVLAETALPENIGTDYVPGAVTGNVLGDALQASYNYHHSSLKFEGESKAMGDVWFGYDSANSAYSIVSYREIPDPHAAFIQNAETGYHEWDGVTYSYYHPLAGGGVTKNWGADAGKKANVVFSFKVKGISGYEVPKINFGRTNDTISNSNSAKMEYPKEYNSKALGYTPKSTTDWETFAGTFVSNGTHSVDKYGYTIGFAQGTKKNAAAFISPDDAYMGIEYPYNIAVSASKKNVVAGETFTVDADIVNQIGSTSTINQNVTWYALNKDRTQVVSGFTVTSGENGTATVETKETLENGTYTLVAIADANKELVKGVNITVVLRNFDDYVPGEIKGNMAEIYKNGVELLTTSYTPFDVAVTTTNAGTSEEAWMIDTMEDISENNMAPSSRGAAGAYFRKECFNAQELLAAGRNIVIGAQVRSTRGTPTIQAAMSQYSLEPTFPVEYPDGLKLSNSEWVPFTATFHIPETGWKGYINTGFNFGFAYTGLVDECKRNVQIKKKSIYIGEEYAYDLVVTSNAKICALGETTSFTVSADVLNQIGSTGYLDQNVTWYALNDDRTLFVDGISVLENKDGTATVTVDSAVRAGTYDIVAVSDKYNELQKGISIQVKNPFEDYVPGEITGNWIDADKDVLYPTWNPSDFNSVGTINAGTDDEAWTVKTSKNVGDGILAINGAGVAGAGIDDEAYNAPQNLSSGKRVVIGAKVKSVAGKPVIKTGMYHLQSKPTLPAEYPDASDGFKVSGSEWQDFGATIKIPETEWRGHEHTIFYLGFVYTGKLIEGYRGFAVKKNSFYMGEEYAHDINVSADSTEWTKGATSEIVLEGCVLNQVGTKGYLNQNITWHALDITRTSHIDGITITENTDGTATLKVAETVPSGVYDIVAVSDAYEDFVRSIKIRVTDGKTPKEKVATFKLTENNGTANFTAAVIDSPAEKIFFAIASYDENNQMVKIDTDTIPVSDGIAMVKNMSLDEVESGYTVRAYIWEYQTYRPIEFGVDVENTVIVKR